MNNGTRRIVLDRKAKARVIQWIIPNFNPLVKDGLKREAIYERCRRDTGVEMNEAHFRRLVADCGMTYPRKPHVSSLKKNESTNRVRVITRWLRTTYIRSVVLQEVLDELCRCLGVNEPRERLKTLQEIDLKEIADFLQGKPPGTPS